MNCLIAAATAKEITPFLDHYRESDGLAGIDILITGIGSTVAAYSITRQIALKRPGFVIQAGIAGSFDPNLSLGSVVVVKRDTIADLSVMENKQLKTLFDLGLVKPNQFPFRNGWLLNSHKALLKETRLKQVSAVTVNHITTSKHMIDQYKKKFSPAIESMEGAALHYVCLVEKIPFLQIRSVSNYTGERNKKKWNIKEAIINLNKILQGLSATLNPKLLTPNS